MAKIMVEAPAEARAELTQMVGRLNTLIRGIALGMGLKGQWSFDADAMAFEVEETEVSPEK